MQVLTRTQGEGLLNGELGVMGARERNQYRKMSAVELCALAPLSRPQAHAHSHAHKPNHKHKRVRLRSKVKAHN